MSKKFAFWFFLLGTLSSAILFIILTVDTHRQVNSLTHVDKLSEDVVSGKRAWEKYNCNDCHTILGFGGYYAPDMTKAYRRLGADSIRFMVKDPETAFANSWRKMPKQNLSDTEINNLVAFLKWVSEIDNHDWPPQDSKERISGSALRLSAGAGVPLGAALFKEKLCIACHSLKGVGGSAGIPLDDVGKRYDAEKLEKYIRNPKSVDSGSDMPAQKQLSQAELEDISDFLAKLK